MTRTVVAAVGVQEPHVDVDVVLDVLRRGVEDVVQRSMGIELVWSTSAIVRSDDLESGTARTGVEGVDWDFARRRLTSGEPEGVAIMADSAAMVADFDADPDWDRYNPAVHVVQVGARWPTDVLWSTRSVGGLTVRVAVSRWAMYGGGQELDWFAPCAARWALAAADALDADTGFVAVEDVSLSSDESAWEVEQRLAPSYRDLSGRLWGAGWGTLLGPAHLAAVGGPDAVRRVSDGVHELPGGRVWVDLGRDPAAVPDERARRLLQLLGPALRRPQDRPPGLRPH